MFSREHEHYCAEFERVAASLPGQLHDARREAFEKFQTVGFPTLKQENWKYTRLNHLFETLFSAAVENNLKQSQIDEAEKLLKTSAEIKTDVHSLVFVDGFFAAELSEVGVLPMGVEVSPVFLRQGRVFSDWIHRLRGESNLKIPFLAFNLAFMTDGISIHLPEHIALSKPIHLIYITTQTTGHGLMMNYRNIITAGAHTQAVVIEHHLGAMSSQYFCNTVTDIFAHENACLKHIQLQQAAPMAFHIHNTHVIQQRDSRFKGQLLMTGGWLARCETHIALTEPGAQCDLYGLYLGNDKQHLDQQTYIDHQQPQTQSKEHYKGILEDHSRGVFNGRIMVRPQAQKVIAEQHNDNLLLSKHAEIDTKPQLEIFADDVRCRHGATVAQLNFASLFYLRARGIDEFAARHLLIEAFAQDIVRQITLPGLRSYVEQIVANKLSVAARPLGVQHEY